jgi:hypothetical protein
MTPKEKAQELFNKYATYVVMWTGGVEVEKQNCKQCALIAVDEIIKSTPQNPSKPLSLMPHFMASQYWQEVKQEIELL